MYIPSISRDSNATHRGSVVSSITPVTPPCVLLVNMFTLAVVIGCM